MESHKHEVIQFDLSEQLKEKLKEVFYNTDNNILTIYVKSEKSKPMVLKSKVDKSSMRNTINN